MEVENANLRRAQLQVIACVSTLAGALEVQLEDMLCLSEHLLRIPSPAASPGLARAQEAKEKEAQRESLIAQRRMGLCVSFVQGAVPILRQQVDESRAALEAASTAVASTAVKSASQAGSLEVFSIPPAASSAAAAASGSPSRDVPLAVCVPSSVRESSPDLSATHSISSRGSGIALELTKGNRSSAAHAPSPPSLPPPPAEEPQQLTPLNTCERSSRATGDSQVERTAKDGSLTSRWLRRGLPKGVVSALTPRGGGARPAFRVRQAPGGGRTMAGGEGSPGSSSGTLGSKS